MKKKIILLAIALMLFAGVVSASSINGEYKGMPIVKITSGDRVLETDEVPGFIYEGHTVVPISTLRQLGASVTWDAYGYSVDVNLPKGNSLPGNSQNGDIKTLKMYSKISDHYKRLWSLGDILLNLGSNFSITNRSISDGDRRAAGDLQTSNERISKAIDTYNEIIKITEQLSYESDKSNIALNDMREILNYYNESIDFYKVAADDLNNYYSTGRYSSRMFDNLKKGDNIVAKGLSLSNEQYYNFYNQLQNY